MIEGFHHPGEHISASRQDPNGVFLARAPVLSEFLFFRNVNKRAIGLFGGNPCMVDNTCRFSFEKFSGIF